MPFIKWLEFGAGNRRGWKAAKWLFCQLIAIIAAKHERIPAIVRIRNSVKTSSSKMARLAGSAEAGSFQW